MEEIMIWEQRNKVVRQAAFSALLLIVSLYVVYGGASNSDFIYVLIGIVGSVMFGASLIFVVRGLFVRRPLITIGAQGITDSSALTSIGLVRWEEIESVVLVKRFRQTFIDIRVNNEDQVISRLPKLRQLLLKLNFGAKQALVSIPLGTAELSVDAVRELLQPRLMAHGRKLMVE